MYKRGKSKKRSLNETQGAMISTSVGIKKIIHQIYSSKEISRDQQVYLMSSLLSNEDKIREHRDAINHIFEALQTGHLARID
jgi:hypothetical protein